MRVCMCVIIYKCIYIVFIYVLYNYYDIFLTTLFFLLITYFE